MAANLSISRFQSDSIIQTKLFKLTIFRLPHSQLSVVVKRARRYPYSFGINHCVLLSIFDPKVTGSLVTRLGPGITFVV